MQEDSTIPQELRDSLTAPIAQRKWRILQKEFKASFYSLSENSTFPFYNKMNQLFTDYASKHLNTTRGNELQDTMNKTSEADVTNLVMQLLDNSPDISQLRCESPRDRKFQFKVSSVNHSCSEASKVRKALAELPKNSISVQQTKMRIVPNTPFNRHYQLSTILNHRNAQSSSVNRPSIRQYASKVKQQSPGSTNDISIIDAPDESFEYEIEALNECDLSEISQSVHPVVKRIKLQDVSTPVFNKISRKSSTSDMMIIEPESCSVLEVPSIDFDSMDELRADSTLKIVPKKLTWIEENLNASRSHLQESDEKPPAWFQKFLNRYDADMKKVDAKMDELNSKLNKILAPRPSLILTHRNIAKMKQENM